MGLFASAPVDDDSMEIVRDFIQNMENDAQSSNKSAFADCFMDTFNFNVRGRIFTKALFVESYLTKPNPKPLILKSSIFTQGKNEIKFNVSHVVGPRTNIADFYLLREGEEGKWRLKSGIVIN